MTYGTQQPARFDVWSGRVLGVSWGTLALPGAGWGYVFMPCMAVTATFPCLGPGALQCQGLRAVCLLLYWAR